MPAYHSAFNDDSSVKLLGNMALLPVKTKVRGPAPSADPAADDIIDETISLFRANCFFRNFEIKGPADRVLIYLTLFTQECLAKLAAKSPVPSSASDAGKLLNTHALANFACPGDAGFPLNAMYEKPANKNDAETLKQYLSQLRQEVAIRLSTKLYEGAAPGDDSSRPSKWWMCFAKRKFMGMANVTGGSI